MNKEKKTHRHSALRVIGLILLALVLVLAAAFGIYLGRYHSGDAAAQSLIETPSAGVTVTERDNTIAFVPDGEIRAGVIFYPGAKIRADAYTPLADALAAEGYLCVLVNMPLNLAVLDADAALSVEDEWPEVDSWYIAGHSMGGLAAQKCALADPEAFSGLILLAYRVQCDFSGIDLPVLGIYATCDGICTPELVAGSKADTPQPMLYTEAVIEGGCHGYFGSYGSQFMDGTPTISREDQLQQTLQAILDFLGRTA